jgi:hypothetical protein
VASNPRQAAAELEEGPRLHNQNTPANPVRFRPLMPVAVLEKAGWICTLVVLYARGQISASVFPLGAVDSLLGVLFAIAFVKSGTQSVERISFSLPALSRAK